MRDCVLLFSGGLDSTLTGLILQDQGTLVHGLSITYDGRPRGEIEAARRLSRRLNLASFKEIRIQGFGLDHSLRTPLAQGPDPALLEGLIPYRNLAFLTLAAYHAICINGHAIAAGHTASDAQAYNDAGPLFMAQFRRLLEFPGFADSNRGLDLLLPLIDVDNNSWQKLADGYNAVWKETWSCWRDGLQPCSSCYACLDRAEVLGK